MQTLKILSFGDIHEETQNLKKLESELKECNIVIISGDLTNYHGKAQAKKIIDEIKEFKVKVYAQPGNLDQEEVNDYLTAENINLHGNGFVCGDVGIFGVGGSNTTPFNTPTEYSEDEISQFLYKGYEKVKKCKTKILVPHMPPKDTKVDLIGSGMHVGSQSVRDFIETNNLDLCICGHIHEARCMDKIGKAEIVNAGMFKDGGYIKVVYSEGKIHTSLNFLT